MCVLWWFLCIEIFYNLLVNSIYGHSLRLLKWFNVVLSRSGIFAYCDQDVASSPGLARSAQSQDVASSPGLARSAHSHTGSQAHWIIESLGESLHLSLHSFSLHGGFLPQPTENRTESPNLPLKPGHHALLAPPLKMPTGRSVGPTGPTPAHVPWLDRDPAHKARLHALRTLLRSRVASRARCLCFAYFHSRSRSSRAITAIRCTSRRESAHTAGSLSRIHAAYAFALDLRLFSARRCHHRHLHVHPSGSSVVHLVGGKWTECSSFEAVVIHHALSRRTGT